MKKDINLLPIKKRNNSLYNRIYVLVLCILIIALASYIFIYLPSKNIAVLEQKYNEINLSATKDIRKDLESTKKEIEVYKSFTSTGARGISTSEMLNKLKELAPVGVKAYSLESNEDILRMQCSCANLVQVAGFQASLRDSKLFADVLLTNVTSVSGGYEFEVICKYDITSEISPESGTVLKQSSGGGAAIPTLMPTQTPLQSSIQSPGATPVPGATPAQDTNSEKVDENGASPQPAPTPEVAR